MGRGGAIIRMWPPTQSQESIDWLVLARCHGVTGQGSQGDRSGQNGETEPWRRGGADRRHRAKLRQDGGLRVLNAITTSYPCWRRSFLHTTA